MTIAQAKVRRSALCDVIVELLAYKQGLADRVMNAAQDRVGDWTREQLLNILRPLA